jgi:putative transposase
MASTYYQMYVQTVFPVKYRKALLQESWKRDAFAVIGNLINEKGCKTLIINGMEDHVHCFFGFKPSLSVSDVMKNAKAKSSKWINENGYLDHRFEWQPGFGCFTYSHSHVDAVFKYIQNQEKHHKKLSFREEYLKMLQKFKVNYDDRYIFHDPV